MLTFLKLLGHRVGVAEAVGQLDCARTGTDLESLRSFASEVIGTECRAVYVDTSQLEKANLPAIVHLRQLHFGVLLLVQKDLIFIHDPAIGPVVYPRTHFASLYSNHLIESPAAGRIPSQNKAERRPDRNRAQVLALFSVGAASRLLGVSLLLLISTFLFLVLNHAGDATLLKTGLGLAILGLLFMGVRMQTARMQLDACAMRQSEFVHDLLMTLARGKDFLGFRGRSERDVAKVVRRSVIVGIPRRNQFTTTLGSIVIAPILLLFLDWRIAIVWCFLLIAAVLLGVLGGVYKCKVSVHDAHGRYTKLLSEHPVFGVASAPEICGELAKWSVIWVAGIGVLTIGLPASSLVFWVLFAMQIGPADFRLVAQSPLVPEHSDTLPELTGTVVENRKQKNENRFLPRTIKKPSMIEVQGIEPLTSALLKPDLTVLELRRIMALVAEKVTREVPELDAMSCDIIRVFGPGHEATSADLEFGDYRAALKTVPAVSEPTTTPAIVGADRLKHIARALQMCGSQEFPLFWDVHEKIELTELASQISAAEPVIAGHLTLHKITFVQAAKA